MGEVERIPLTGRDTGDGTGLGLPLPSLSQAASKLGTSFLTCKMGKSIRVPRTPSKELWNSASGLNLRKGAGSGGET